MDAKGITSQAVLARKAGVSYSVLSRILAGKGAGTNAVRKLARHFDWTDERRREALDAARPESP